MLRGLGVGFWSAVAIALVSGCAGTAAYDGPRVPAAELAHIEADRVGIHIIDDNRIADSSAEILSGEHAVTVSLASASPSLFLQGFRTKFYAKGNQTVCFTAFEGRRYVVQPAPNQTFMTEHWRAAVFDKKAQVFVDHRRPVGRPHPTVPPPPTRPPRDSTEDRPAGPPAPQKIDSE